MTLTPARRTARILLEAEALAFRPETPFVLASGATSPVYIDCRRLIGLPRARRAILDLAEDLLETRVGSEAFDAIAGAETAGIPFAAWLADRFMLPMLYVRKMPKGFGRNARIEGRLATGQRVLLVDDLAADGTSKLAFAEAIREAGGVCAHGFVILDHGVGGGAAEARADAGFSLHALATLTDVLDEARADGRLPPDVLDELGRYVDDPASWSAA